MTSVFLLGATGYIGGSVLVSLKAKYSDITVTTLARSASTFLALRTAGGVPVQGGYSDLDKVERLAFEADIVVNGGDSDDVALTQSILRGIKTRYEKGLGVGTLVHTSGVGVFLDGKTEGKYDANARPWSDANESDMKAITPARLHGPVDVLIFKAGVEGYVDPYIICPSAVYGVGTGPVQKLSTMYRMFIPVILQRKSGFIVGEGTNTFGTVHVKDLASLYVLVFEKAFESRSVSPKASPYAQYYIASTDPDSTWRDIFTPWAKELHRRRKLQSAELTVINPDEIGTLGAFCGASVQVRPERARALGWEPKELTFEDCVAADMDSFFEVHSKE